MTDTPASELFEFLRAESSSLVARVLAAEKPALAAAILFQLDAPFVTKILAQLPLDSRKEIAAERSIAKRASPELLKRAVPFLQRKIAAARTAAATAPPTTKPTSRTRQATPQPWEPRRISEKEMREDDKDTCDSVEPDVIAPSTADDAEAARKHLKTLLNRHQRRAVATPAPAANEVGRKIDGLAIAAEILRHTPAEVQRRIASTAPDLYQTLRERMFMFADLERTEPTDLAKVFTEINPDIAALALRFASNRLAECALSALSPRRAELIRDEITRSSEKRERIHMAAIDTAQETILQVALALQAAGQILIDPDDSSLA